MKILITDAQGQVRKELVSIANQRGFGIIMSGEYQDWINQQYEK